MSNLCSKVDGWFETETQARENSIREVVKVKFLMKSNMTLTVLNLHQKTDPKVQ